MAHYIAVSSITYAYKAKAFFDKAGVKSYIVKTPKGIVTTNGCSYSIKVEGDGEKLSGMLKEAGIKVTDVFNV